MIESVSTVAGDVNISHVITVLVALVGWFFVHRLTAWRDRKSLHRKLQTDFLIRAYQELANSSQRKPVDNSPYFRKMESAFADIQLFGSKTQIALVETFLTEFAEKKRASFDPLLNALRSDLRKELGYEQVSGNVRWFRPEGAP
jgi:hypothetical protein